MMAASPCLRKICTLRGHEDRVWHVAWRPSSRPILASTGADLTIRLWGIDPKKPDWHLLEEVDTSDHHGRTLRALAWDPNGVKLAVASFDASISVWRTVEQQGILKLECITVLSGHENEVKSAAFSSSDKFFASCSRDRSIWVYDAEDTDEYECVALLQSHSQDVKAVKWHPQQDVLFSCSYDDTIKVWGPDGDDWCCKETLEGHESTVWSLSFDSKGSHFVTCSDDRTLRIWAPTGTLPADFSPAENAGSVQSTQARNVKQSSLKRSAFELVKAISLRPLFRGDLVPATAPEAPAPVAPMANGGSQEAPKPRQTRRACRSAPEDACCSWSCVTVLRDFHPRPVYSADWSPRSDVLASACGDDRIRVFQAEDESLLNWECVANELAHKGDVNCVAWGPQTQSGLSLLASAGDDGAVVLWEFG
mmetsp:Transcript_58899/g.129002  ORF Transcript_58899/g.129002 Transcript_58899/m.129002 type:complete len:422 (+) Transcript_58899:16-1281(+)